MTLYDLTRRKLDNLNICRAIGVKKMIEWCEKNNKDFSSLTDEELESACDENSYRQNYVFNYRAFQFLQKYFNGELPEDATFDYSQYMTPQTLYKENMRLRNEIRRLNSEIDCLRSEIKRSESMDMRFKKEVAELYRYKDSVFVTQNVLNNSIAYLKTQLDKVDNTLNALHESQEQETL